MASNNESSSFLYQPQPSPHLPIDFDVGPTVPPRYCTPRTIMAVESIGSGYHSYKKAHNIWSPHYSPESRSPMTIGSISAKCPELAPTKSIDCAIPDKSYSESRASPSWSSWSDKPYMGSSTSTLPVQGLEHVICESDVDLNSADLHFPNRRSRLLIRSPLSSPDSSVPWSSLELNDYVSYEHFVSYDSIDNRNDWNPQAFGNELSTQRNNASFPLQNGVFSPSSTHQYLETTDSMVPQNHSSSIPMVIPSPRTCFFFKSYKSIRFSVPLNSRFFVIKSYSILDVNASFIHNIWTSTELGNKRLAAAHAQLASSSKIFLLFLVNSSGRFCGISEMISPVDYNRSSDIWVEQTRWKGIFDVEWLLIKDVPNRYFQHLKVPSNDHKPVTNSRDTQEIPFDIGISMMKIVSSFR